MGKNLPASAGLATEPIAATFQVPKSLLMSLEELLIEESERGLFTKHIFDDPGLLSACSDWARLEFGESPDCVQISCLVAKFFSIGRELITSDAFQSFDDWAAIAPSMAALSTMNGMVIERKSRALRQCTVEYVLTTRMLSSLRRHARCGIGWVSLQSHHQCHVLPTSLLPVVFAS